MSSWVAPAVAAEIWGISVEQVLAAVAAGTVTSRHDGVFFFVDIDPDHPDLPAKPADPAPAAEKPKKVPKKPATPVDDSVLITREEMAALADEPMPSREAFPDFSQLHSIRARTSHRRRPPAHII